MKSSSCAGNARSPICHLSLSNVERIRTVAKKDVLTRIRGACDDLGGDFHAGFHAGAGHPDSAGKGAEPVWCRLICSLPAGADQLAADVALDLGYSIQAVLPAHREVFREDIRGNSGSVGDGANESELI